jgi:adenylate cyclase
MPDKATNPLAVSPKQEAEREDRPPKFAVKLRLSISTLFLCLILPSFAVFVFYIYKTNYEIYKRNAAVLITTHNDQTSAKLIALLDPIGDSLLTLAKQVRDDPRLFDSESFHDTMRLHLDNNPNLVSIFVASEKGSFHQVQSVREGMVVANRVPPANARYNFWVVDRSRGVDSAPKASALRAGTLPNATASEQSPQPSPTKAASRARSVFTFYNDRDTVLDSFVVDNNYDARERPFYKALSTKVGTSANIEGERFVYIGEPFIASSTSQPTINVSAPIFLGKTFSGMVGESFELSTISNFLKSIQISKNCETYILDTEGNIVVSTGPNNGYKLDKNTLIKQNVLEAVGKTAELAVQIRHSSSQRQFEFKNPATSEVYLAQFTPFPNKFNKNWEVLTLAPVSDFLVGLNEINRQLILYGGFACVLLVLLTYILSMTISRPIESLTEDIRDLLEFNRSATVVRSNIFEINILSNAVNKLRNTLKAFTSYVPRDLVNDLLRSGSAIELGGESRYLTIMFTDLKDFSTISEVTPSRALLKCVSAYLALVSYAVKEEVGTVDKFIGDSVMAFWGAPLLDQNHAYHACVTAVKSQRRMIELNRQLVVEGLPALTVRIGIHSDAVLVGNIGSSERMSYTVMGDGVNVAARLEGINKEFATSICISHATFKEAGERLWTRPVDVITVKGRKGEIPIYELVAIKGEDEETMATQAEQELCALTHRAFSLFTKKQYEAAAEMYEQLIRSHGDGLSIIMKNRCLQKNDSPV